MPRVIVGLIILLLAAHSSFGNPLLLDDPDSDGSWIGGDNDGGYS